MKQNIYIKDDKVHIDFRKDVCDIMFVFYKDDLYGYECIHSDKYSTFLLSLKSTHNKISLLVDGKTEASSFIRFLDKILLGE